MTATRPRPLGELLLGSYLPGLDGLRAVAVFLVMICHFHDRGPGDLGVSLFFVLSGFLITWLLLKEHHATGRVSFRNFFIRRTLRIAPAYYCFIAVTVLVFWVRGQAVGERVILCALTYTMNFHQAFLADPPNFAAHAWSLAQEEQFYLVWPLLFVWLVRKPRRTVIGALTGFIVAVFLWRSFLCLGFRIGAPYVYHALDTRIDTLALGCLVAVSLQSERFSNLVDRAASRMWMPLATLGALIASRQLTPDNYHYSAGFTIDAMLIALFMLQCLRLHATALWKWLENPVIRYLGAISYPLYLYHGFAPSIGRRMPSLTLWEQDIVNLLVAVVIASGSYYFVERPFLHLRKYAVAPSRANVMVLNSGPDGAAAIGVRATVVRSGSRKMEAGA